MIFVILGIVILVISFIIALVSLTREQKKLGYKTQDSEDGGFEDVKTEEQESLQVSTLKTLKTDDDKAIGPFPWEEGFRQDQKDQTDMGEAAIEKIQAELATRINAKKPNLVSEGEKRSNLAGEISIDDLKRERT